MNATSQHGSSRRGELVFVLVLAGIALAIVVIITNSAQRSQNSQQSGAGVAEVSETATPAGPTPTFEAVDTFISPENFPGVPAIVPSLGATDPSTPSFKAADVETYVFATYPGSTIKQIEFLSAEVVEERYQEAPGAFGGRLLCVVSLHGEFHLGAPPGAKPLTVDDMVAIFDAHTGNQLMETYP